MAGGFSRSLRLCWTGYDAVSLFDQQLLVCRLASNVVYPARGPMDGNGINPGGGAQAEVETGIAGRFETAIGTHLSALLQVAGFDFYSCAESVTIGLLAHKLNAHPVTLS